jgi:5-methylcytosine-specific restriction enzyme subunit McrC
MNNILQVYEYEKIPVNFTRDGVKFEERHFNRIALWGEKYGAQFFSLGYRSIVFKNYVGVIRVADLTIEILPKIDKSVDASASKWKDFLVDMLIYCGRLKLSETTRAQLSQRKHSLFEIYIYYYLDEIDKIVRDGLVKKYRQSEGNERTLKGKLHFTKQIAANSLHMERFYVSHSTYDYDNNYNRILKTALLILRNTPSLNPELMSRCTNLLLLFEHVGHGKIHYDNITYDRNTERYKEAITIAVYIIERFTPDLSRGVTSVIAFLFNMNQLYEEYLYHQCRKAIRHYPGFKVYYQKGKRYWNTKLLKPDILINYNSANYIIDAKWKIVSNNPGDADLRQMFVYNIYWSSKKAFLVYPKAESGVMQDHGYDFRDSPLLPEHRHGAYLLPINIFHNARLNRNLGKDILECVTGYSSQVEHNPYLKINSEGT